MQIAKHQKFMQHIIAPNTFHIDLFSRENHNPKYPSGLKCNQWIIFRFRIQKCHKKWSKRASSTHGIWYERTREKETQTRLLFDISDIRITKQLCLYVEMKVYNTEIDLVRKVVHCKKIGN